MVFNSDSDKSCKEITAASLINATNSRNLSKITEGTIIPDELDTVKTLDDLNETTTLAGFQFKRWDDHALFYNLVFDKETKFRKILQSIKVDSDLHIQLQYNGISIPLPQWFLQGQQHEWLLSVCLKTFLHTLVILPLKTTINYLKK